jgi:hypothetical protein
VSHPLAGHLSVDDSARRIRHYRYLEERMMRVLGGWIALTPELPAKLLLGRHVWDCAQHADLWGKRLPELRAPAQRSEPANERVVRFMELLEQPEAPDQTVERITGLYRVLKPHLITVYARHLVGANPIYEPPTRRILERCLVEERRHVVAGSVVLERFARERARERSAEWQARLVEALADAGGATGDVEPPLISTPDAEVDAATADRDLVEIPPSLEALPIPADLVAAVEAHGRALADGDVPSALTQVTPAAGAAVGAEYAKLPVPSRAVRVVAVATIGAYRVVKLRFEGPRSVSLLQLRWRRGDDGWRVAAAELVRSEPLA